MSGAYSQNLVGFGSFGAARPVQQPFMKVSEIGSPGAALYRHLYEKPVAGVGRSGLAATETTQLSSRAIVLVVGGVLVLAGLINFEIGRAMAPSKADESKWGWINAIGGTLFPPTVIFLAIKKNHFS